MKKNENIFSYLLLWFVKLTAAPILFVLFKLRIVGRENKVNLKGRCILIANHISTWDPVLVNYVYPLKRIYFMAASIMFTYNCFFTWFLNQLGAFSVSRDRTDLNALGTAMEILENDSILGIFPEGKRSLTGELLPFKPGAVMCALATGAPIIPLYLMGDYKLWHRMTVVIGEPIDMREYCDSEHPPVEKLHELCTVLEDKMNELRDKALKACGKNSEN